MWKLLEIHSYIIGRESQRLVVACDKLKHGSASNEGDWPVYLSKKVGFSHIVTHFYSRVMGLGPNNANSRTLHSSCPQQWGMRESEVMFEISIIDIHLHLRT